MDIKEVPLESVDWIDLTQDADKWRAVVNTVMKFCGNVSTGDFMTIACELLAFKHRLCSMESVGEFVSRLSDLSTGYRNRTQSRQPVIAFVCFVKIWL
jgi:hypothetical protein